MARHARNDLLSSLDEVKTTARVRGDDVRAQQAEAQAARTKAARGQQTGSGRVPASPTRRTTSGQTVSSSPVRPVRARSDSAARRSVVPVLFALLVVVVFVVVLFAVRGCTAADDETQEGTAENTYVSPYKWNNLVREDGRWSYVVNGQVKSKLGIDVSENQHEIDWWQVANDGIDFAMIRLGYRGTTAGDLYLDAYYWDNLDGARNAGIDCGVYFFSQAITVEEAIEEAEFVLTYLDGASLEYPIAFDSEKTIAGIGEGRTADVGRDEMTAIAEAFCKRVEEAGYTAMVYGNAQDLSRYRRAAMEKRLLWWAEYGSPSPLAKIDIAMWQYSNEGQVAGISTNVDMNIDLRGVLE